ncbi:PA2169 family four-helix-bundle protein [Sphingobacterium humi]|uniref:PA2169 family four-helix-bundle protein n=1 Tax=Sphingobacterium humi TaxID=1796905 RepID=A0A6N8L1I8_9SPHI|nr:PA2169 family four-helix-bundle protein [Sphingobacterium humi]MVZ63595.1 PA2169 family four-helix-bundle protein [Sphingobacterium humi]
MENIENKIDLLHRAIIINNDRIEGYEKAIELAEPDHLRELQHIFHSYVDQSSGFVAELNQLNIQMGGEPEDDTKFTGKIYRMWMEVKTALSSSNSQSLLELCEKGEDEFKKTYDDIISEASEVYPELVSVLHIQLVEQNSAHKKIKELRDL